MRGRILIVHVFADKSTVFFWSTNLHKETKVVGAHWLCDFAWLMDKNILHGAQQ
jgi:hypothetical protein